MKKTVLITILLITAAAVKAMAGNDTTAAEAPKVRFTYFFETRMGADMLDYPGFGSLDWTVAPGCSFSNGLSLRLPIEYNLGMHKESYSDYEGVYMSTGTIGLNLGYDLLRKSKYYWLELNASGGSSYLKTVYRFAYADLSLKFGSKFSGAYYIYFGLGLRYLKPYNPDMSQKLLMHCAIGFRF